MATLLHSAETGHANTTFGHVVEIASNLLGLWRQRVVTRRELGYLDDRMLQDIGFSRLDAEREMSKPFWRE
ncbi:DUF1127 domain-containing protein [Azospirillum melinis]|uniref:YjiS-like domain-containing protein n=2 Tax=Azospirillum TaxID=191 RepID=A0A2B8B6U3_9PROT|nr:MULTISPECIES: DUF1127 domain-containing protein [Azospirillum]MBP2307951.1 uncharacterized protein YjiS (DUF1127 family) [Azospirillum melinis]NUB00335.1 DUF1127 domain-containing protein [Azospirillum melinis]PGH54436.1 hypothetical protein CRT60_32125 [Azospirillum palustre]PWC50087.1 hypothetical protein TSA6c_29325 [Azospirillum sp. TSA6c]PWC79082.1 hypothetical protein TSH64_34310 [Azospirillum sp. TSH64]